MSHLWLCAAFALADAGDTSPDEPAPIVIDRLPAHGLAQEVTSPLSQVLSLPFELNFDRDLGAAEQGTRYQLKFKPLLPFVLGDNLMLVSRTSVAFQTQNDVTAQGVAQTGIGDFNQSLFFGLRKPTFGWLLWGIGPETVLPTASNTNLGSGQVTLGPTVAFVTQLAGWTISLRTNQQWAFGGGTFTKTLIEPVVAYTTHSGWTFDADCETTYDWQKKQWTVPLTLEGTKLVEVDKQPLVLGAGLLTYPYTGPGGPQVGLKLKLSVPLPQRAPQAPPEASAPSRGGQMGHAAADDDAR